MNALGTPALAGTFPTSDNSAHQRGCVIGTFGGSNLNAVRAMLRYLATDKLEFNFQAAYTREVDEAAPEVLVNASPSTTDNFVSAYNQNVFNKYGIYYGNEFRPPPGYPYSSYASFASPLRGLHYHNQQGQNSTDLSGKMDYDITDGLHLKAVLAYSNYGGIQLQNPDLSPLAVAYAYATFDVHQGTAEVNLTGSLFDKKLEWVVGGFWLRAAEFLGGAQNYVVLSWAVQDYVTVNNKSGFAHLIYHVTPRLSVFGGARYSADEKSYSFDHPGLLVISTPFPAKQNLVDWTVGTNYQITDDVMSYVTVATGSRPPGIFARPVTQYQLTPIPSEKLISYETGLKSDFLDHRLRLNLAAYYTDYSKYLAYLSDWQCLGQTGTPTPVVLPSLCPPGGSVTWGLYTTITAHDEGGEVEATAEPLPGLLFNLNGGYNDFQSGVTTPGKPGYIAPGNLIQPKWNIAAGVQYEIASKIGVFTPRLDWVYQSEMTFNPSAQTSSPKPLYIVPGRSVVNARLTYEPNDAKWAFVFSATNLTNKYYYWDLFTGSGFDTTGNLAPPREFKFSAHRNFF
jgi:iron complex outermembrane receptor protein